MKKIILTILILLTLFPFQSFAAQNNEFSLNADQVFYFEKDEKIKAFGNVNLHSDSIAITSEEIIIDLKSNKLKAKGNIKVKGDNFKDDYLSEEFEYNINTESGIIIDSKTRIFSENIKNKENAIYLASQNTKYNPEKIEKRDIILTTCDSENPSIFFKSKRVIIYPDNKITAYRTTFYELGGKIPLYYFPVISYSLKYDSPLYMPEIGYNQNKGFFVRNNVNYFSDYGEAYQHLGNFSIDYYNNLGLGLGVKHYETNTEELQRYINIYNQFDKRDNDSNYWFNVELANKINKQNTYTDFKIIYNNYGNNFNSNSQKDNYLAGQLRRNFEEKNKETENNRYITLEAQNFYNNNTDHNFFKLEGIQEYISDNISLNFLSNLERTPLYDFKINIEKAFEITEDKFPDIELDWDYSYTLEDISVHEGELELNTLYSYSDILDFEFNTEYEYSTKEKNEHLYLNQFLLKRNINNSNLEISTELKGENSNILEYSLPKFKYQFSPFKSDQIILRNAKLSIEAKNKYDIEWNEHKQYGGIGINYNNRKNITNNNKLIYNTDLLQNIYSNGDNQWSNTHNISLLTTLFNNLENKLVYTKQLTKGEGIKDFEITKENQNLINNEIIYSNSNGEIKKQLEYDFNKDSFIEGTIEGSILNKNKEFTIQTQYDFLEEEFEDLKLILKNKGDNFSFKSGIKSDLNKMKFLEVDTQFNYEKEDNFSLSLSINYDLENEGFSEGSLEFLKDLNCRSIGLSYDHVEREIWLNYKINAFPSSEIDIGADTQNKELLFEEEIESILK